MIFRLILVGLLLLDLNIDAQSKEKDNSIIIIGRIVDFDSLEAIAGCRIYLNGGINYLAVSKMNGSFQFEIPSLELKKRIKLTFKSIGFLPFVLKNIPIYDSIIDLGTIILPTYIRYDDFCKVIVLRKGKSKYSKSRTKQYRNELLEKQLKENEIKFQNYKYIWNGYSYKLNIKNNYLDLRKPSKH
jgi:hypothetical protein